MDLLKGIKKYILHQRRINKHLQAVMEVYQPYDLIV